MLRIHRRLLGCLLVLTLAGVPAALAQDRDYLYGTGIAWGHTWPSPPADVDAWNELNMDRIQEMGGTNIGGNFAWIDIERERDVYDWTYADFQVSQAEERGLEIFAYTGLTPDWALPEEAPDTPGIGYRFPPRETPEMIAEFEEYLTLLATRYCGRVRYYQFWNEPNGCSWINDGCSNGHLANTYVPWLQRWYTTMKAACPDTVLSVGGLDCHRQTGTGCADYIRGIYDNGGGDYFDAVALHPYGDLDETNALHWAAIQGVADVLREHGDEEKMLWLNEWGWNTSDEPTKARLVEHVLTELEKPQYDMVFQASYLVVSDLPSADPASHDYGLCDRTFSPLALTPRDSWCAFRNHVLGIPNTVDTVLVIDSSGSMAWNDPNEQRIAASRVFLNTSLPGDQVALVDFDDSVVTLSGLAPMPDERNRLEALLNQINALGGTNIGLGVERACQILQQATCENTKKAVILLTDGVGSYNGQNGCLVGNDDWVLFALGFGGADLAQLQSIAEPTGGFAKQVPIPEALVCEFQRMRALLAGGSPDPCAQGSIGPGQTVEYAVTVPPGSASATATTSWPGSDIVMTLTTPSGRVIDRSTAAPDVTHDNGPTFEVYTIANPEPGVWEASLYGADVDPGGEQVVFGFTTLPAGPGGNNPPDVSAAMPSLSELWPPNHKMKTIQIFDVTDPDGDAVTLEITGITQDEPVAGPRNHAPDGDGLGLDLAFLRAERDGDGNGRVYEITFTARDDRGGETTGTVQVCVPHDNSGTPCTDDGQLYDSTVP